MENNVSRNVIARKAEEQRDLMLVSMYIGRGDETASKRKSRSESLLTFPGREKDTGQRLTVSLSDGQNEIFNNISPSRPLVNYAVEAADEFSPAPVRVDYSDIPTLKKRMAPSETSMEVMGRGDI